MEDVSENSTSNSAAAMSMSISVASAASASQPLLSIDYEDKGLATLTSIWDCPKMIKLLVDGGKGSLVPGWRCGWCKTERKGDNATKALNHVAKISKKGVSWCTTNIPQPYLLKYRDLYFSKQNAKSDRSLAGDVLNNSISDMQARVVEAMGESVGVDVGSADVDDDVLLMEPPRKRMFQPTLHNAIGIGGNGTGATSSSALQQKARGVMKQKQLKLHGNTIDPGASQRMNIAVADFIHSNCLPFSLAEDPKFLKLIQIAAHLPRDYKAPTRQNIAGKYLDKLYEIHWAEQTKTLLSEASVFGITIFGDGATIKTTALFNVLAAGVNNPFALLDVVNCTDHHAQGGMKDASHIAGLISPLIEQLEGEVGDHNRKCAGIVDLFFYGASNVQNAGELLRVKYPRITLAHGAEHVVSLLFDDVYKKVSVCHRCAQYVITTVI